LASYSEVASKWLLAIVYKITQRKPYTHTQKNRKHKKKEWKTTAHMVSLIQS
jgi:hypothetical protein